MTDEPVPFAPPPDAPPPVAPPAVPPPPVRQMSRRRSIVAFGVILAFLGIVLYVVKDNTAANDLKAGDCFDIPSADTVKTVVHHACTEPHTAEVFLVVQFSGSDMQTPLTFVLENFVGTTCGPA